MEAIAAQSPVIHRPVFLLGFANNLVMLSVFALGCIVSGFQCSGDEMGGIMMAYALTIFIPQLLIGICVMGYFLWQGVYLLTPTGRMKLTGRDVRYIGLYLFSLLLAVFSNCIG